MALGGGFSLDDSTLDDWVQSVVDKDAPRVCFVGTASGDDAHYFARFMQAWTGRGAVTSRLPLFSVPDYDIAEFLADQDIVYVGGGNTANMLAIWRLHGVDEALRAAYDAGVTLAGISAGVNCWFEASSSDSFGDPEPLRDGLGLLPGSFCPHYNTEPLRRPLFHQDVLAGDLPPGIALDDGAGVLIEDEQVREVVSYKASATAYRVVSEGGAIRESCWEPRPLVAF